MRRARRRFLGACAALAALPRARAALREVRLKAGPARLGVVGAPHPDTDVWTYNGAFPGPEIRLRQGDRLRVRLANGLPQETTIHWHGIRLPNAMDGVPHLTQKPVPPGGEFLYEFELPDAGHAGRVGNTGLFTAACPIRSRSTRASACACASSTPPTRASSASTSKAMHRR